MMAQAPHPGNEYGRNPFVSYSGFAKQPESMN
jgi:hypothetical protein